jgi:chromate transporter
MTLIGPDGWALFAHFLAMSMLAIGGALATAPEIHRYIVGERHWLDDSQFSAAVALAQAAPGPNLLFVPVVGYAVAGFGGAMVALTGMLIPSTTLALAVSRWGSRRREQRGVRAFVAGMAPVTVALLFTSGGLLAMPLVRLPGAWLLVGATLVLSLQTKINPVWLMAGGAAVGAIGWV